MAAVIDFAMCDVEAGFAPKMLAILPSAAGNAGTKSGTFDLSHEFLRW